MHRLKESDVGLYIIAEPVLETGFGIAILDQLRKAAHQYKANTENHTKQ